MHDDSQPIGRLAVKGVAWSIVQSWGGRLISFLLMVLLARFLDPAAFGVASVAVIVLGLVTQIAEFGFADAVVQRRQLEPADVNLPFYAALAVSVVLAAACAALSGTLEIRLGVPGLAPVVAAMVLVAPFTTISRFQEMNYRRLLGFRKLAFRVLVANLVAGTAGVVCAALGAGVWSLVVQAYLAAGVGLVWLWARPVWWPGLELRPRTFLALTRFGLPITTVRLVDFAAVRFYEVLLIGRFGIAAYGLYAVGARLYETLLQLLQGALADVSLTILSRISDDRDRMAEAYLRTLILAAFLTAPVFVLVAALIPEIAAVLFGGKWAGVDQVARPMLLLGAVQALSFFNAPFLVARGRPSTVMAIGLVKSLIVPLAVILVPTDDLAAMVQVFALALLTEAPLSFVAAVRDLGLSPRRLVSSLVPAALAAAAGWYAVGAARPAVAAVVSGPFLAGLALGVVFAIAHVAVAATVGFRQVAVIVGFVRDRVAPARGTVADPAP